MNKLLTTDLNLNQRYLEKLKVIEDGGLNGEIIDETKHFETFFPNVESFLKKALEYSRNPNKTLNMNYLEYGIKVPEELGREQDAIDYVLPFYNSIDSRSGLDWRNVMPITLLPAVLGAFGAITINPNLVTSKYGKRANELELRVVKSLAKILGYTDLEKAGGLSLEGGTKGNTYGYIFGLRKAFPEVKEQGLMSVKEPIRYINSQAGHFSNFTNLAAIGVGRQNAARVPANPDGSMQLDQFRKILDDSLAQGFVVPTVLATVGTTDSCAIDDIKGIHEIIEELSNKYPDAHRPHLHIDAAIGWAFSFYSNYDIENNPLHFSEDFCKKLKLIQERCKYLHLADSITLDVHKTGFCPYSSSFIIVKDKADFDYLMWDSDEFKYFDPTRAQIAPVQYSLECSRSAVGVYATAMALNTMGHEGYQTLLGAGLQYSNILKKKFTEMKNIAVINQGLGFTVLFRPYPSFAENAEEILNRELNDPDFQTAASQLNDYINNFYKFWKEHKKPDSPLLDDVKAAAWSQYGDNDFELSAWKAYLLNPRAGQYIKTFLDEFIALHKEYEKQLPDQYLQELESLLN